RNAEFRICSDEDLPAGGPEGLLVGGVYQDADLSEGWDHATKGAAEEAGGTLPALRPPGGLRGDASPRLPELGPRPLPRPPPRPARVRTAPAIGEASKARTWACARLPS